MKKESGNKNVLWDIGCLASIFGIWPRFIEPYLLFKTKITLSLPNLPLAFDNFKIAHFSDLHFGSHVPDFFLKKLRKKILTHSPHLIAFTGDFLSYASLEDGARLQQFLNSLHAPYGCFAVLGNHDYTNHITINEKGEYDIALAYTSEVYKRFKLLFKKKDPIGVVHLRAKNALPHTGLKSLLTKTSFKLLENETTTLCTNDQHLNICGLGEHMAGHCFLEKAFEKYDHRFPGLILTHNPDSLTHLKKYPGEIILCGHTHGIQVNFPWIRKKTVRMETNTYLRGLKKLDQKWVYINRGIGATVPFRLFSPPELLILTLKKAS